MGNHSETGELLEEAGKVPITQMSVSGVESLVDQNGNTIELGNPTRLKDSGGRDVDLLKAESLESGLTKRQAEAIIAKRNNKKAS